MERRLEKLDAHKHEQEAKAASRQSEAQAEAEGIIDEATKSSKAASTAAVASAETAHVTNLKAELGRAYLIASFVNGSINIYHLKCQ